MDYGRKAIYDCSHDYLMFLKEIEGKSEQNKNLTANANANEKV